MPLVLYPVNGLSAIFSFLDSLVERWKLSTVSNQQYHMVKWMEWSWNSLVSRQWLVGNFLAPRLASRAMEAINSKQSTIPPGKVDGMELEQQ